MREHYGKLIILVLITILSIVTTAVIVPLITIAVAGITIFHEVVVAGTPTRDFSDGQLNWEGGGGSLKTLHKRPKTISNDIQRCTPSAKDNVENVRRICWNMESCTTSEKGHVRSNFSFDRLLRQRRKVIGSTRRKWSLHGIGMRWKQHEIKVENRRAKTQAKRGLKQEGTTTDCSRCHYCHHLTRLTFRIAKQITELTKSIMPSGESSLAASVTTARIVAIIPRPIL